MMEAKVAGYKKERVKQYVKLINDHPIIGLLNMMNLPASQLVRMRQKLKDDVIIMMGKKRLFRLAFADAEKSVKGISKLAERFENTQPALLFTKKNPFILFKTLQKSKTKAPAKPGDIAPSDIVVKAGPTPFAPGPIISELGKVGLKTAVEEGKIAIKADKVVAKEGEVISPDLSSILLRLGLKPMEVGLDLVAAYEDGLIFNKKTMRIDEQEYIDSIAACSRWAVNLSFEAGIINPENAEMFVTKAFSDSRALALSENILADAVLDVILAKAESQMNALRSVVKLPDVIPEEKKEEAPEEKAETEESKEEVPEENKEAGEAPAEEPKEVPEEKKEAEAPAEGKEAPKEEEEEEEEEEKEAEPAEEGPKEETQAGEEKDVIDYEVEQTADETKDNFNSSQGINKIQEAVEELKEEEIPSVNDLFARFKAKACNKEPLMDTIEDDEIDRKVCELAREVKYRESKREEGDAERIIDSMDKDHVLDDEQ